MFAPNILAQSDPELWNAIRLENQRQEDHVELIAAENYVSRQALIAQRSQLTNKYAEGYPGKRYYGEGRRRETRQAPLSRGGEKTQRRPGRARGRDSRRPGDRSGGDNGDHPRRPD